MCRATQLLFGSLLTTRDASRKIPRDFAPYPLPLTRAAHEPAANRCGKLCGPRR